MNSPGKLYIVSTPIGNLEDISSRTARILGEVDFIAAEDTRVTAKILNHLGLKKSLISCQKYNEKERSEQIVSRILTGENAAFCSDAGTPVISDPGGTLVSKALDEGVTVIPIPGPSAVVTALSVCGLRCERFCFEGFLPTPKGNRKERLEELLDEKRTIVLYEAPHKLQRTLRDLLSFFGNRRMTVCREMTKIHEEIWRTDLEEACKYYDDNPPKGEFVLVIEGNKKTEKETVTLEYAAELARMYMEKGDSASEAAKKAAKETGFTKSDIYKAAREKEE